MDSSVFVFWFGPFLSIGFILKIINKLANSVDPNETAHNEPSHLDLHKLHCFFLPVYKVNRVNTPTYCHAGFMQFQGLIINQRNLINHYNSLGISEDDKLMIFFLVFLEKRAQLFKASLAERAR